MRIKETLSPRSFTLCVPEVELSSPGFCSFCLFSVPGAGLVVGPSWLTFIKTPGCSHHFLQAKSSTSPFSFILPPGGFHPSVQSCLPATRVSCNGKRVPKFCRALTGREESQIPTSWGSHCRMGSVAGSLKLSLSDLNCHRYERMFYPCSIPFPACCPL